MIIKIIPNLLSFSRIILTPVFLYFILAQNRHRSSYFIAGVITYFIVCLTDFLDGKTARRFKAESPAGQRLDIAADSVFILSSSLCLTVIRLLPFWVTPMIIVKLAEFIITSGILSRKNSPVFDPCGRAGAVLFYILPLWTVVFSSNSSLILTFLVLTAAVNLVSSFTRVSNIVFVFPSE